MIYLHVTLMYGGPNLQKIKWKWINKNNNKNKGINNLIKQIVNFY